MPDWGGWTLKHFPGGVEEGAGDGALFRTRRADRKPANPKSPRLMNSDNTTLIPSSRDGAIHANPALSHALRRGLGRPISALRASMESLVLEFEPRDPRGAALDDALGEVARLGRNVRDLIDYAYPPEPHEMSCGVDEILYSARFQLPRGLWRELLIARDLPGGQTMPKILVDGPVLSRSLARLIQAGSSNLSGGVLLHASWHAGEVHFGITFQGTGQLEDDPMGLCHAIAQRDLGVLGCLVEERTTPSGNTTIRVRIPAATAIDKETAA